MLLIFISYFIIYKVFTSYVGNFWKEVNSVFLSNLEIASLVKGTDLDYVIEVKNEVRYMNLNITEKQKKTIVNDLKKTKKYRNK